MRFPFVTILSKFPQTNASLTLKQATTKQWVKQADYELPEWLRSLRVINQQLWCCCHDASVMIFDSELQQQRTVPAGGMGKVNDAAEMSNGDVVIAAHTGLYDISNGE